MLLLTSFPPVAEEGTGVVDCSGARSAPPLAQEPQSQETELAAIPKNSIIWSQIRGDIQMCLGNQTLLQEMFLTNCCNCILKFI